MTRLNKPARLNLKALPAGLLLLAIACPNRAGLPWPWPATPTPVVIRFELSETAFSTPNSHRPATLILELPLTPAPPPDSSPSPTLTPTPTGTGTSPPTLTPTPPPPTAPAKPDYALYTGPVTDKITLLDPAPGFTLPPGLDRIEFKWRWQGEALRACRLPDGFGFEIRIWPNPDPTANPHLPPAVRPTIRPWGVADAAAIQPQIDASCDPNDRTRRYTVASLSRTPAVSLAQGRGHFYWDVAYVQLQPDYALHRVSAPRDFSIPGPDPAGPALSPTPIGRPAPEPAGTITLLEPSPGHRFPVTAGPVQFRWRWQAQTRAGEAEPCDPLPGYGFELRIWSQQPGYEPLGVLDAVSAQDQITCDPASGTRSYTIPDLLQTPGLKATYTGQNHWDGRFWWDVVLVSLDPYRPPRSAPPPADFEISLAGYPGPLDPSGPPLTCPQFKSWPEAQALFLAAGGPNRDPHHLDPDGNTLACDQLRPREE